MPCHRTSPTMEHCDRPFGHLGPCSWVAWRVVRAAEALYLAGAWRTDDLAPERQADLWRALRDALGLPPGTATRCGVSPSPSR